MGKAGRQRRLRKEQARQRARTAAERPASGPVPSPREQVAELAGVAIEAVCSGDERTYRAALDQLAAERSRGVDPGGQPRSRRQHELTACARLARRLAARRTGQAFRPGTERGARGDGRGHDRPRGARLPRRRHRPALGRPGWRAARHLLRPGYLRGAELVGERRRLPDRVEGAEHRPHVLGGGRDGDRDRAPLRPPAAPGDAPSAPGNGLSRRGGQARERARRRRHRKRGRRPDARPDSRAARQGRVNGVRRGSRGTLGPGAGAHGQVQHRPRAARRAVRGARGAVRPPDPRRRPLRGAEGVPC